jgi:hypothetical protein
VTRLSRQCGILSISQPYRPPQPVTRTALLSTFNFNTSSRGSLNEAHGHYQAELRSGTSFDPIQQVLASNLDREVSCFPQHIRIAPQIGHDRFLTHPFQFTI